MKRKNERKIKRPLAFKKALINSKKKLKNKKLLAS